MDSIKIELNKYLARIRYLNPAFSIGHILCKKSPNYYVTLKNTTDYYPKAVYFDLLSNYGFVDLTELTLSSYFVFDDRICFIKDDYYDKISYDTRDLDLVRIPVSSFDEEQISLKLDDKVPAYFKDLNWIDDDFLRDESISFDEESYAKICLGKEYLNPKHFSVKDLVRMLLLEKERNA